MNNLNLVYDDWDITQLKPNPNGEKIFGKMFRSGDQVLYGCGVNNIKNFRIEEVIKSPNMKFYYIVSIITGLEKILFSDNKIPLSNDVINYIRNNSNIKLIFLSDQEYESENCLKLIELKIKNIGINPKDVWIINNNSKLSEYKEKLKTELNVYSTKSVAVMTSKILSTRYTKFKEDKEHFFMCHNRSPKHHRYAILSLLKKNGLLINVDWSLMEGWNYNKNNLEPYYNILSDIDIKNLTPEIDYFSNIDQKKSKYEEKFNWCEKNNSNGNWGLVYSPDTYENSYVNITTESLFINNNVIHITEKSFKPFYHLQYPLIIATQNHNKELKKLYNFDLFEDVINYDFDNEYDNIKRFSMIFEEIKRIYKNKDKFISFYSKNKERFINNQKKVIEISNNIDDIEYFKKLI